MRIRRALRLASLIAASSLGACDVSRTNPDVTLDDLALQRDLGRAVDLARPGDAMDAGAMSDLAGSQSEDLASADLAASGNDLATTPRDLAMSSNDMAAATGDLAVALGDMAAVSRDLATSGGDMTGPADLVTAVTDGHAAGSALRIEEIYVDRDLSGDAVEFVELTGPVGATLDNISLRLLDTTGKVKYTVAVASTAGTKIPASGRWTVGGNSAYKVFNVLSLDNEVGISSWGLDNTAGSVQLVQGTAGAYTLLDVVGYNAAVPAPSTDPKQVMEAQFVKLPDDGNRGQSIGRRPGSNDTDNNAADFCIMAGTPKAANGACL